jgi:hypothetical protein
MRNQPRYKMTYQRNLKQYTLNNANKYSNEGELIMPQRIYITIYNLYESQTRFLSVILGNYYVALVIALVGFVSSSHFHKIRKQNN